MSSIHIMRLICSCLVLSLLAALRVAATEPGPVPVAYRLTPRMEKGALVVLTVEMRFRGHADGETTLYLPDSWAGQKDLWREIRNLTIEGASATEPSPATRLLHHNPRAAITIRYDIVQISGGDPLAKDGNPERPVVRPSWFFAVGNGIFAVPQTESPNWLPRPPARFSWGHLPAGWRAASDLDHGKMGRALTIDDVAASTLLGGVDVRILSRRAGNAQLRLALRGKFRYTDEQLVDAAAAIIATEREFWGDPSEPYFVSVTPLVPNANISQRGGTGRGDGFAMYQSPDVELKEIVLLLAHESEHTWLPDRVGGAPNEKNEGHSWFGEGFADYYGIRTLVDAKVFSPKEYVAWWNTMLFRHANSPARNATNNYIVEAYWTDANVRQLPYDRGAIFAAYANSLARSATQGRRSLDDVVRRMKVLAVTDRRNATELFPIAFREITGVDIADQIARFIDRGESLTLQKDAIGACAEVQTFRLPAFDRGFDIAATIANGRVITGVDPNSPAFAAGMRDGMTLIRREGGRIGDSRESIAYVVRDGISEKTVRYLPVGKDQVEIQEVVLKPQPLKGSNCKN